MKRSSQLSHGLLTCQVHGLFRLHQIQSQGLHVPEVLLQHWVLKAVTSVKTLTVT